MKIKERHGRLGTLFSIAGEIDEINRILIWLRENNIRYIQEHIRVNRMKFMIRDKTYIMAFKLRWM